ncbi:hypothetical protein L9F63_008191 [Diploptera punctata]|uniref:Intimal thickness related receptor IRP domain-containing protein n=1 Tax=Diploptera punctata TaxID=6984 RepID=A0AAD7Z677_DIPPU|nr:hypothetical protein L9F63_008191 [Diploptera punctata]
MQLVLLVMCPMFHFGYSKYVEGHIVTAENWAFVARFCFLSEEGQFEYYIEYESEYAVQNILLYYDSKTQWPAVYKSGKTCLQKEAVLNITLHQIVNLTASSPYNLASGCVYYNNRTHDRRGWLRCHNARRFRSARERWWFLAVSNCNGTKGLNMRYKFLMTNGPPGDYWHEHFSADEFYILPNLMASSIAYLLLILAVVMCTVELKSRQLFHTTYKLFVASVLLQELGNVFQSIAYIKYAFNGVGFPRTKTLGRLCESASETVYLLLLLLLAKGFTVTRGRLRLASSVKLTIFMCLYIVTYMVLFIYERLFFDPGEVLYMYESPAGYGLIFLRVIAWWMFVYSTIFTLKHYPEKARFYYPFNIVGTLWFMAGPAFILAANNLIDKWVRESVVSGVQHSIALIGHILFLVLTVPSRANKVFPYHVRTTQIGVMEVTDVTDTDTTFPFRHHQYAPSAPPVSSRPNVHPLVGEWVTDVPVELFTVSRSVAMSTDNVLPKSVDTTQTFQQTMDSQDSFLAPSQIRK